MRSIRKNYESVRKIKPNLGEIPSLFEAVKGRNYSKDTIKRFFIKYIPKDDYDKREKNNYITQLTLLSNKVEAHKIEGKSRI